MREDKPAKTVLLADDESGILFLLRTLCESLGYRTIEARDGVEAVASAKRLQPDVVIMDVSMPGIDGFKATEELKSDPLTADIPVIMLTGLQSREDRLHGISSGASDFLTKPLDAEELALRLDNSLKLKEHHDLLKNNAAILEQQVALRTVELRATLGELQRAHLRITEGYIDTISRLAVVSEYKDEDTAAHIRRIGHYTQEMAIMLGLNNGFGDTIFHAAMMHDIGKVSIPEAILMKPASLTPDEWTLMKGHTLCGARILGGSDSPHLVMAEQIAMSHHERWDGTGYPSGLRGDQIPLAARITNLADQYDALRNRRPYKPAFSHARSVTIITEGDGRTMPGHFDPAVLSVFHERSGRFEQISEEEKDEE